MAFVEELAARVRSILSGTPNLDERKMFGGLAYLLNGNLLVGVRSTAAEYGIAYGRGGEAPKGR
jgi:hypothetical protein